MPDFGGVDAMPMRTLAPRQQKVDRGRCRAAAVDLPLITKCLAKMSALRRRLEIEQPDHRIRGQVMRDERRRQDRFLRSRISANTFHAGLPASPTAFATSASSARRNGLAAFSAAMVAGIVGLPEGVSFDTSASRAASALLFGSMVLAK